MEIKLLERMQRMKTEMVCLLYALWVVSVPEWRLQVFSYMFLIEFSPLIANEFRFALVKH